MVAWLRAGVCLWYKNRASVEDLVAVVCRYRCPAGVEWQGFFEEREEDEDLDTGDYGHHSIVTRIDPARADHAARPYPDFWREDRVFRLEWFIKRWWDVNVVPAPDIGAPPGRRPPHAVRHHRGARAFSGFTGDDAGLEGNARERSAPMISIQTSVSKAGCTPKAASPLMSATTLTRFTAGNRIGDRPVPGRPLPRLPLPQHGVQPGAGRTFQSEPGVGRRHPAEPDRRRVPGVGSFSRRTRTRTSWAGRWRPRLTQPACRPGVLPGAPADPAARRADRVAARGVARPARDSAVLLGYLGRATIHGFITTSLKLYGEAVFLRVYDDPDFVAALHDWITVCLYRADTASLPVGQPARHVGAYRRMLGHDAAAAHYGRFVVPYASGSGGSLPGAPPFVRLLRSPAGGHRRDREGGRAGHRIEHLRGGDPARFGGYFRIDLAPPVELLLAGAERAGVVAWLERTLVENGGRPAAYRLPPGTGLLGGELPGDP